MATRVEGVGEDQKRDLASGTHCQGCALTSDSQNSRVPSDCTPKLPDCDGACDRNGEWNNEKEKIQMAVLQAIPTGHERTELARKCLQRISTIAERGAASRDPMNVGSALQELSQILFERTGRQDIIFDPVSAENLESLETLLDELDFADSCSQSLAASEANPRGTGKV